MALAVVTAAKTSVRISGRSLRFAQYIPALIVGIVALGLGLIVFMSSH